MFPELYFAAMALFLLAMHGSVCWYAGITRFFIYQYLLGNKHIEAIVEHCHTQPNTSRLQWLQCASSTTTYILGATVAIGMSLSRLDAGIRFVRGLIAGIWGFLRWRDRETVSAFHWNLQSPCLWNFSRLSRQMLNSFIATINVLVIES